MTQEVRMVVFTIDEPFKVALRMLRRELACEGLRIPCAVSTLGRLQTELGVGLKDSIALYVDAPPLLLEATVFLRRWRSVRFETRRDVSVRRQPVQTCCTLYQVTA
jgi:hypothetical protein